jgi:hypothetical protein
MKRDEMIALRKELLSRLAGLRHIGDYGAGAQDIRETAETLLKVIDHLLERLRV